MNPIHEERYIAMEHCLQAIARQNLDMVNEETVRGASRAIIKLAADTLAFVHRCSKCEGTGKTYIEDTFRFMVVPPSEDKAYHRVSIVNVCDVCDGNGWK